MNIRIILLTVVLCMGLFSLSATSPAQIPLSSPLYEEIDLLYRLSGLSLPSTSRPWNTYEALALLDAIDKDTPYENLRTSAHARIAEKTYNEMNETFSYRITPAVTLESYIHTNDEEFTSYDDWIYSYDERQPLLDLTLSMQFSSSFLFETSLQVGAGAFMEDVDTEKAFEEWGIGAILKQGDAVWVPSATLYRRTFSSNIPLLLDSPLEPDFPRHSQLTYAGPWWAISLGRGVYSWGGGESGNLVIGDHISNHTGLSASLFNPKAKIQLLYLFFSGFEQQSNRIFLGHRFEFNPTPWARISISENVMAKQDGLSLQYLDPTYIYHNIFDSDQINSIASIEADITPLPRLSIHGQFAIDQLQLASETASTADALAYILGGSYSWSALRGFLTFTLETASTDPSFYRREDVDFLVARDLIKNQEHLRPVIIDYLGYEWGSDSKVYQLKLSYLLPQKLSVDYSVTFHRQGELTYHAAHHVEDDEENNEGIPTIQGPSPYGEDITERLIIGLGATYQTAIPNLELYGRAYWIGSRIYHRSTRKSDAFAEDVQLVVGIT
ncbi:MAG: hypothetical protein ACQ5SW_01930, partial [Sphaerochaetaceae bacterium]